MSSASQLEEKILNKLLGRNGPTWPLYVLFFAYLIIDKGPNWIEVVKKNNVNPSPVLTAQTSREKESDDNCIHFFPLKQDSIKISYDKVQKTGDYYSPTGAGNTIEGTVWLKEVLKPNFKEIFIEYEILTEKKDKPPSLIWIFAREIKKNEKQIIAKIWAPEYTEIDSVKIPQLLGFAQTKDYTEKDFGRGPPEELPDPVKRNQLDSLTIEPTYINGTEMSTNFTYNFTSDRNNIAIPYNFTRKLVFPFSNLANSGELLDIGVGTYIGNKFRIVSLNICY